MNIVVCIIWLFVINIDAGVAQGGSGGAGGGHLGGGAGGGGGGHPGAGGGFGGAGGGFGGNVGGASSVGEPPMAAEDTEDLTDANFNQENFRSGQVCHRFKWGARYCPGTYVCAQATGVSRCCRGTHPTPCSFNAKHGCCRQNANCCTSPWGTVCCSGRTPYCCYGGCCAFK